MKTNKKSSASEPTIIEQLEGLLAEAGVLVPDDAASARAHRAVLCENLADFLAHLAAQNRSRAVAAWAEAEVAVRRAALRHESARLSQIECGAIGLRDLRSHPLFVDGDGLVMSMQSATEVPAEVAVAADSVRRAWKAIPEPVDAGWFVRRLAARRRNGKAPRA